MFLYHGTTERHLPRILEHGLQPRKEHNEDNWAHSVSSHPECVYLSVAYPLYFADGALKDGDDKSRLIVLEIDTDYLDEDLLGPDEDFLAQVNADPSKKDLPMKEKNEYYREIIHKYDYKSSLAGIGNCTYRGTIPPEAITRIVFLTHKAYVNIFWSGYDPMISVINFRMKGENYMKSTKWLFDPDEVEQEYAEFPNPHNLQEVVKYPQHPFPDTREGIEVMQFSTLLNLQK
jgi:hypothetical protein